MWIFIQNFCVDFELFRVTVNVVDTAFVNTFSIYLLFSSSLLNDFVNFFLSTQWVLSKNISEQNVSNYLHHITQGNNFLELLPIIIIIWEKAVIFHFFQIEFFFNEKWFFLWNKRKIRVYYTQLMNWNANSYQWCFFFQFSL